MSDSMGISMQFNSSVIHTLSVFSLDNCQKLFIGSIKRFKNSRNKLMLLRVKKRGFLSKITKQTYFDTKITVNEHVCTTPISGILDKSLFKS